MDPDNGALVVEPCVGFGSLGTNYAEEKWYSDLFQAAQVMVAGAIAAPRPAGHGEPATTVPQGAGATAPATRPSPLNSDVPLVE